MELFLDLTQTYSAWRFKAILDRFHSLRGRTWKEGFILGEAYTLAEGQYAQLFGTGSVPDIYAEVDLGRWLL